MVFESTEWWALAAVVLAGFVRGLAGFGAGMILVPSLSLLYSPLTAVLTVALLEIVPALQLLPGARRHCHWRSLTPMALAAMLSLPLGAWVLVHVDAAVMRVVIAAVVLGAVALLATGWRYTGAAGRRGAWLTGAASGVAGGACGLGGLPVVLYYLSVAPDARTARASVVVFLLLTVMAALLVFAAHGVISAEIGLRSALLAPAFALAIWLGGRCFGHISEAAFRAITLTVLGSMGFMMLLP